MARESDPSRHRRVSATEASRSFASLLEQVERGRRFLVRRHGKDVCLMSPPETERRTLSECAALMRERLRGRPRVTLDDQFGADLLEIINMKRPEYRPSWDSGSIQRR